MAQVLQKVSFKSMGLIVLTIQHWLLPSELINPLAVLVEYKCRLVFDKFEVNTNRD